MHVLLSNLMKHHVSLQGMVSSISKVVQGQFYGSDMSRNWTSPIGAFFHLFALLNIVGFVFLVVSRLNVWLVVSVVAFSIDHGGSPSPGGERSSRCTRWWVVVCAK